MCKTKPEKTSLLEARKISYSLIEIIKKLLKLAERRVTVDVKKAFLQKCDQFWRGLCLNLLRLDKLVDNKQIMTKLKRKK